MRLGHAEILLLWAVANSICGGPLIVVRGGAEISASSQHAGDVLRLGGACPGRSGDCISDSSEHVPTATVNAQLSKKVSMLLTILASNNLPLLRIVLATVQDQAPHSMDVRIVIIVNSRIEGFFKKVSQEYGARFEVVETWSNGRPGAGHNSCLRYFRDNSHEDYLYVLDGDDFLYTTAFLTIAHIIQDLPFDVVMLAPSDALLVFVNEGRVSYSNMEDKRMRIRLEGAYKLSIQAEDRAGQRQIEDGRVIMDMYDIFAVGGFKEQKYGVRFRTPLWSRPGVKAAPDPLYDENMFIHDDVSAQFWSLEKYLQQSEDVRVRIVLSTHLLLYNGVNPFSVTTDIGEERFRNDNFYLFQDYQHRYAPMWRNGSFFLYPRVVHGPVLMNPAFRHHKEEFLAKYAPIFHEYWQQGNAGGRRDARTALP